MSWGFQVLSRASVRISHQTWMGWRPFPGPFYISWTDTAHSRSGSRNNNRHPFLTTDTSSRSRCLFLDKEIPVPLSNSENQTLKARNSNFSGWKQVQPCQVPTISKLIADGYDPGLDQPQLWNSQSLPKPLMTVVAITGRLLTQEPYMFSVVGWVQLVIPYIHIISILYPYDIHMMISIWYMLFLSTPKRRPLRSIKNHGQPIVPWSSCWTRLTRVG